MQRLLTGSILFSWIALMMAAAAGTIWPAGDGSGLLRAILSTLTDPHSIGLAPSVARALITVLASITLAVMLWALMFAVSTGGKDASERRLSMVIAFGWALAMIAVATVVAMIGGSTAILPNLFAMQMASLLSMLAAGSVEYAGEARLLASAPENANALLAKRLTAHMATTSARLAAAARPVEKKAT
jgi:hypothetical protein